MMFFSRDEYQARWSRLHDELKKGGYPAAVFWERTGRSYDRAGDVYYLTNYASQASGQEQSYGAWPIGRSFAALLVLADQAPELHIAEPVSVIDRAEIACGNIFGHENLPRGLAARLMSLGIEGPVAYQGDDFLPLQIHRELLEASHGIDWIAESELLYGLQSHKSARELDLYRRAGEVVSKALTTVMEGLIAGDRECDAAARAATVIIEAGGGFQRVACHHGPKSEFAMWNNPLYSYSTSAPLEGELVRGWIYGPILEGYWLDPGRTAVCGSDPDPGQRKLVEDCVGIVDDLIAAHRVGITAAELGALGDDLVRRAGYPQDLGAALWDLYGHGLSTFWLPPAIPAFASGSSTQRSGWHTDEPYHTGQVCTVEVFIREPGIGTAALEQVFILHDDGTESLITTPMVFW